MPVSRVMGDRFVSSSSVASPPITCQRQIALGRYLLAVRREYICNFPVISVISLIPGRTMPITYCIYRFISGVKRDVHLCLFIAPAIILIPGQNTPIVFEIYLAVNVDVTAGTYFTLWYFQKHRT